jgi:hypothetical protein
MTLQVENAGTVSSNGEYSENSTHDGFPQLNADNGNTILFVAAWQRYYILDMIEEGYTYKTEITDGNTNPAELEWFVHFGGDPAPTVTEV